MVSDSQGGLWEHTARDAKLFQRLARPCSDTPAWKSLVALMRRELDLTHHINQSGRTVIPDRQELTRHSDVRWESQGSNCDVNLTTHRLKTISSLHTACQMIMVRGMVGVMVDLGMPGMDQAKTAGDCDLVAPVYLDTNLAERRSQASAFKESADVRTICTAVTYRAVISPYTRAMSRTSTSLTHMDVIQRFAKRSRSQRGPRCTCPATTRQKVSTST